MAPVFHTIKNTYKVNHVNQKDTVLDSYPCNRDFPSNDRRFYAPGNYLTAEHQEWFYKKTGFEIPEPFLRHIISIPPLLTKNLVFIPLDYVDHNLFLGGIGFCDHNGVITQYRPPVPTTAKYLSISDYKTKDNHQKIKTGIRPIVIEGINKRDGQEKILTITEGFTKAACIAWCGYDSIHIPGVTMWDTPHIKNLINAIKVDYDRIVLVFDKDWETNINVKRQLFKCSKAHGADIATWNEDAKGFDDLMLLRGIDDRKGLREVISSACQMETGYLITSTDAPYQQMGETIKMMYPDLYFDGMNWVNEGDTTKNHQIELLLIHELQKFYYINRYGNQYHWATQYSEPLAYLKLVLTKESDDSTLYVKNGFLNKGKFTITEENDPRSQKWSINPELEDPTEIINFFKKCHIQENAQDTSLDIQKWGRSLLDNQIPYGAILSILGSSGSGKSSTLNIIKSIIRKVDTKDTPLTQLDKTERIAGLGSPRLILQSDCQQFPQDLSLLYMISDAQSLEIRKLYQTAFEQKTIYSRIAFGCVNIPYVSDTNGGFSRRLKTIFCQAYKGMGEDIKQILSLLESPEYVERLANWFLKANLDETKQFMDTTKTDKLGVDVTNHPAYQYVNKTLINTESMNPMSLERYYEGLCIFSNRNHRKPISFSKFEEMVHQMGVEVTPALHFKLGGVWINEPAMIFNTVDPRLESLINNGYGSFAGIHNEYFLTKLDDEMEKLAEDENLEEVIIAVDKADDVPNVTPVYHPKEVVIFYTSQQIPNALVNLTTQDLNNFKKLDKITIKVEPGFILPRFVEFLVLSGKIKREPYDVI